MRLAVPAAASLPRVNTFLGSRGTPLFAPRAAWPPAAGRPFATRAKVPTPLAAAKAKITFIGDAMARKEPAPSDVVGDPLYGRRAFPPSRLIVPPDKKYGSDTRADKPGSDEIFPVAVSKSLIKAFHAALPGGLGPKKIEEFLPVFETIHRMRVPTWAQGVAGPRATQHRTTPGQEAYTASNTDSARHHNLRLIHMATAMEDEMKGSWTVQSVARAGMRAAAVYTLNNMWAPPLAKDIRGHMLEKDEKKLHRIHDWRENLKDFVAVLDRGRPAPDRARGGDDADRDYGDRSKERDPSPSRRRSADWAARAPRAPVASPAVPSASMGAAKVEAMGESRGRSKERSTAKEKQKR